MSIDSGKAVDILGVHFDNVTFEEVVERIERAVLEQRKISIATPNTDYVVKAQKDARFLRALNSASLSLPDSAPIILASWLLGKKLKERVPGSDLSRTLCERSAKMGYSLFFLGAAPGVAETAKTNMEKEFPGVRIAGCYSPNRSEITDKAGGLAGRVSAATPNVVLVAFGAPLQEEWIVDNLERLNAQVAIGVGSGIDYMAGTLRRAPKWMYRVGLEWLFRLLQEPRRLFRRYVIDDMAFFPLLAKGMWRKKLRLGRDHAKD